MPVSVARPLQEASLDAETVSLGDGTKVYRALLAGNIEFDLTPGAPTITGRAPPVPARHRAGAWSAWWSPSMHRHLRARIHDHEIRKRFRKG
jgi:hypothetical protein